MSGISYVALKSYFWKTQQQFLPRNNVVVPQILGDSFHLYIFVHKNFFFGQRLSKVEEYALDWFGELTFKELAIG